MQIAGIVAEYNPFHNGHLYQITQTRAETGCDAVVAIMSGNFSQRGTATIADKFTRTKMALLNGIDLVLELPVPFATASAEMFARAAVSLLHQSQIIDFISFGSECGDISLLDTIAQTFLLNAEQLNTLIKYHLKQGLSFPRSRQQAVIEFLSHLVSPEVYPLLKDALESPNNILGIEYLKAIHQLNASITPFTVKRISANYHDKEITGSIASATAIRHSINDHTLQYQHCMPSSAFHLLNPHHLPSMESLASFLHFKLIFSKQEELYASWDIPKDLIHTFIKHAKTTPTYETLVNLSTSKTYTRATVQRALLRILLDIHTESISPFTAQAPLPYIRVLGCRKEAISVLRLLSSKSHVPLITNLGKQYDTLDAAQKQFINYELRATKLYHYLTHQPQLFNQDFTQPFILI